MRESKERKQRKKERERAEREQIGKSKKYFCWRKRLF